MKLATRSATAARRTREPRFLVAHGQVANGPRPRADPGVLHKGFGSFRLAVRGPPRGSGTGPKQPGARTRHNRNSNRQHTLHTALGYCWQGSLCSKATPAYGKRPWVKFL